jgi:4-hydroxy 2-oxovalerate aldolase
MNIKLLDCTLRDGGYYNNWDFDADLVKAYLSCMKSIGIDFVEIGFRSIIKDGFKGAYAYSTDSFLDSLDIPSDLNIGIMINASELFIGNQPPEKNIEKLINQTSKIKLIRIAAHLKEFKKVLPVTQTLKNMGYMVGINLMQISEATEEDIIQYAEEANKWPLDVLYFADSLGSLDPLQIQNIIINLRKGWDGEIGIHTHDSKNLAMINSKTALSEGATWIDSTLTGMGRGPGNAKTENTIIEFEKERNAQPNLESIADLIDNYFNPLQEKYSWGTNIFYYLAGEHKIHPTYIQLMLEDDRYETPDILSLINHLKEVGGTQFSKEVLETGRQLYQSKKEGTWNPNEVFKDKEVLIIGSGPSAVTHKEGLEDFIKQNHPIVLALNTKKSISESLVDLRTACHPMRIIADCEEYFKLQQKIVLPFSQLPPEIQEMLPKPNILDYGIFIEENKFNFGALQSSIPLPLVVAYALSFVTAGKASKIYLAGIDGFNGDDSRSAEMNQIFHSYFQESNSCEIVSITPTKNNIPSISLYAI